jgi:hypothetical protein
MIDITGQKVLVPTILFALLSLPQTQYDVYVNALFLGLLYFGVTKSIIKMTFRRSDFVTVTLLYILLTPGHLFSIPIDSGPYIPVLIHSFLFAILFAFVRSMLPQYY